MSTEVETVEEIKANMANADTTNKTVEAPENKEAAPVEVEATEVETEDTVEAKKPYPEKFKEAYANLSEVEKEAWSQGWRPKELFAGKNRDGSPRQWSDAETFLSKTKEALPVANERIKELSKEIEKAKKKAALAEKLAKEAEKRGYDKAVLELAKKQEEAVELGDVEEFRKLKDEESQLMKSRSEFTFEEEEEEEISDVSEDQTPPASQLSKVDELTIKDWVARNNWYNSDKKMAAYANQLGIEFGQQYQYLSLEERLDMIEQDVRETFKTKFKKPSNAGSRAYEAGSSVSGVMGSGQKGKGYNDLPSEARNACEKLLKMRGYEGEKSENFRNNFAKAHFSTN